MERWFGWEEVWDDLKLQQWLLTESLLQPDFPPSWSSYVGVLQLDTGCHQRGAGLMKLELAQLERRSPCRLWLSAGWMIRDLLPLGECREVAEGIWVPWLWALSWGVGKHATLLIHCPPSGRELEGTCVLRRASGENIIPLCLPSP